MHSLKHQQTSEQMSGGLSIRRIKSQGNTGVQQQPLPRWCSLPCPFALAASGTRRCRGAHQRCRMGRKSTGVQLGRDAGSCFSVNSGAGGGKGRAAKAASAPRSPAMLNDALPSRSLPKGLLPKKARCLSDALAFSSLLVIPLQAREAAILCRNAQAQADDLQTMAEQALTRGTQPAQGIQCLTSRTGT